MRGRILVGIANLLKDSPPGGVAFNGHVTFIDKATGNERTEIILSLFAPMGELLHLHLPQIDPKAAFRALKGIAANNVLGYVPVPPILRYNTADKRIVEGKEVLSGLAEDENIAAMPWEDFEHLIRELFEKEFGANGIEVKVTHASRDSGVDAIAFDPDPIRGGKFVMQAKRYTRTVDVSAVRDLFGTVQNEGANRGILVTTSKYGPDSLEFARGKPLTLLNGANLLALLNKHGYRFSIDLDSARKIMNEKGWL
jgi:restriction system protein